MLPNLVHTCCEGCIDNVLKDPDAARHGCMHLLWVSVDCDVMWDLERMKPGACRRSQGTAAAAEVALMEAAARWLPAWRDRQAFPLGLHGQAQHS